MRRILGKLAIAAVATLWPAYGMAGEAEDKAAAQDIAAMLRDSGQMQDYSVGVKCKNGTVWLNGRVTSPQQMQSALSLVSDAPGVEQIVNNLAVAPGKGPVAQQPVASPVQRASASMAQPIPAAARSGGATRAGGAPTGRRGAPRPFARTAAMAPAGYTQLDGGEGMGHPAMGPGGMGPGGMGPAAMAGAGAGRPIPAYAPVPGNVAPAAFDEPNMPNCAWPSYAAYPNYAAVTYPKQYSASAWPFIGPFYPYPQVPLGWRKVSLEWDDGWWFLDFDDRGCQ